MKSFFRKNLSEITASRSLQYFGAALFFSHLVTAFFWFKNDYDRSPLCWSFFPSCKTWTPFLQSIATPLIVLYGILAVVGMGLFLFRKPKAACVLFAFLSIFKLIFHLSDYRLMGNYHYMSHIINFLFLFFLDKKNTIRLFIVLFYFSAGLIKFNTDWLSGEAMLREPLIKGKLLELSCAYVIVLELAFSFLLLSKDKRLRIFALIQFIAFHIFSWHIVGYFYPTILFSMLTIFILAREPFQWPRPLTNTAAAAIMMLAQLYPLIFEPQSSLNGRGRILSLNMLDSRAVCETRLFITYKNKIVEYNPTFPNYGIRIHCDPVLILDTVKKTCADMKDQSGFVDITLDHQVRRSSSMEGIEQITFKNVCQHPLQISFLGRVYQNEEH